MSDLLAAKKLPETETSGVWEAEGVFQCFLGATPTHFDVLGLHSIALCGVYGPDDYKLSGPVATLSLPLSLRCAAVAGAIALHRPAALTYLLGVLFLFGFWFLWQAMDGPGTR